MVWFKSCPRCDRGDIVFEADQEDCRIRCIQCGYSRYVDNSYQAESVVRNPSAKRDEVGQLSL